MPIPEERLYNSQKLNIWFALSSVVMAVCIIWMIAADYSRPWKQYQDNYYAGKAAMARLEYLTDTRQVRMDAIAAAKQKLAEAKEHAAQTVGPERADLERQLADVSLAFRKANDKWSRTAQPLDVTRDTYERTLAIYGEDHQRTVAAHQKVLAEEAKVDKLRITKEKWEDEKKRLEARIRDLDAPVRKAQKALDDLEKAAEASLAKDLQYRGVLEEKGLFGGVPIVGDIINAPLFDFTAPKNTPARRQVNQLVLPEVRQQLNYLETYTTDRCTTCHVAIDDPEFSKSRLAVKLEAALPGLNEALQRVGKAPLAYPDPPTTADGVALAPGEVTKFWDEMTREDQDAYFEALLAMVNDYLKQDGRPTIKLQQPILAHPDLDLFVSVDSKHPMAKIGCTVCHEGNPQETDFVLAAHVPETHKVEEDWAKKYYTHHLGVTAVTFETVAHYWDRPMRLKRHTEAGCAKCHTEITDIARFRGERQGSRLSLGRFLFTNVGCINCHNVDSLAGSRRVGPDLTHVAEKLSPAFVQQWVYKPQGFRPSTRMPHFFKQENNRKESANKFDTDPVRRTETEVAAISKYLFTVSRDWQPLAAPDGVQGDVERGRALFKKAGCLGCHGNMAEFGEDWITEDLVKRIGLDADTARHRAKGMTYEERVRYGMKYFVNERDTFLDPEKARFDPEDDYHTPILTRFAPELSGIGSKVSFEWLYSWLRDPTHYAPETKMPSLRLSGGEAADIAAYLSTLRYDRFVQREFEMDVPHKAMADDLVFTHLSSLRSERRSRAIMQDEGGELTDMIVSLLEGELGRQEAYDLVSSLDLDEKKMVWLGQKSIAHYGCYACHKIVGFADATPPGTDLSEWAAKPITQLDFAFYDDAFSEMRAESEDIYGPIYPRDASELNHLSPLDDLMHEQITHTHSAFAKHKMMNPRIWDRGKIKRPYDKLKMPNFYFTEKEADALTTFLLSRVPPRVSDSLKVNYATGVAGPIARGRNLTRELNCIGCHPIEDNAPTVQQYFRRTLAGSLEFDSVNAPPSLRGEGAKLQHPWFHRFLQQVQPLRPWLQIRMPSFHLTGDDATTLVEYFAALSRWDADRLKSWLAPVHEYIDTAQQSADSKDNAAGQDWYEQESLATPTEELVRFSFERGLMREVELDPINTPPRRFRRAHEKLLHRAEQMAKLYDVEYPFVEPPHPLSPKGRFDKGYAFFKDMGCLGCHVLGSMLPGPASTTDEFVNVYRLDKVRGEGDEAVAVMNGVAFPVGSKIDGFTLVSANKKVYEDTGDVEIKAVVEGPNASGETEQIVIQAPSAPNLSLAHQRLRREWVYQWMLIPGLIQPGTKMPQNFPGGKSPLEGDERYPGTSADHINLLVDFLYDAGTTNMRAPIAKTVVAPASDEEFDEEFNEEEFDD